MNPRKFYRINQYITAKTLRVINEKGKQTGIISREEALKEAQKAHLDLVEIAPNAKPPVVKIIDFKKFKYLEKKKAKKDKKTGKKQETKELRVRPFIGDSDLNFRIKRATKFLKEGNRVRIVVRFRGREFSQKDRGHQLIEKFAEQIKAFGQLNQKPKMMGKNLVATIEPTSK